MLVSHFRKCSLRQRVRERHALSFTVLKVSNLPLETSKGRLQFKKKKKNQTRARETQLARINRSFDINLTLGRQIRQVWETDLRQLKSELQEAARELFSSNYLARKFIMDLTFLPLNKICSIWVRLPQEQTTKIHIWNYNFLFFLQIFRN